VKEKLIQVLFQRNCNGSSVFLVKVFHGLRKYVKNVCALRPLALPVLIVYNSREANIDITSDIMM